MPDLRIWAPDCMEGTEHRVDVPSHAVYGPGRHLFSVRWLPCTASSLSTTRPLPCRAGLGGSHAPPWRCRLVAPATGIHRHQGLVDIVWKVDDYNVVAPSSSSSEKWRYPSRLHLRVRRHRHRLEGELLERYHRLHRGPRELAPGGPSDSPAVAMPAKAPPSQGLSVSFSVFSPGTTTPRQICPTPPTTSSTRTVWSTRVPTLAPNFEAVRSARK